MIRRIATLGALVLLCAAPASAYVRSRTATGAPLRWDRFCIPYHVHEAGSAAINDFNNLLDGIAASFAPWEDEECSGLSFYYQGVTSDDRIGYQQREKNINVILFRETRDAWEHQTDIIAVTTVTFCDQQQSVCDFAGEILDADVEMNGAYFAFTNTDRPVLTRFDLRNTLTHEIGHLIGLDHTSVAEATMFAMAPPGEISKRDLHADDIQGLCDVYPLEDAPEVCEPFEVVGDYYPKLDSGGGDDEDCASAPGAPTSPAWPWLLLLAFALRRRRAPVRTLGRNEHF